MGKKLYVGNLSYNVSSSDLEQLFSQFGSVQSAQVITDRETGRGKGFGFVEMGNEAEANAAINGLNEQEHDGRRLTVNEAKPREARTTGISVAAAVADPALRWPPLLSNQLDPNKRTRRPFAWPRRLRSCLHDRLETVPRPASSRSTSRRSRPSARTRPRR